MYGNETKVIFVYFKFEYVGTSNSMNVLNIFFYIV